MNYHRNHSSLLASSSYKMIIKSQNKCQLNEFVKVEES